MLQRFAACSSLAVLLALGFGDPTRGYAQEGVTVKGEIVDLACYMSKGSKGPAHKACAQMCAKKGLPIGVLTDTQGVFLLLANEADSASYEEAKGLAGERVEVSGSKFNKAGMVSIVVGSIKPLDPQAALDAAPRLANRTR